MAEFELIDRIRARVGAREDVILGIGDDAAVIAPRSGHEMVATTDAIVLDRHFTADWPAEDVGYLAAQANLSDLAAMGAEPRWALLALTLPEPDPAWLDGLLDGLLDALAGAGAILVGGNLARGPLNVCMQLLGEVPAGSALTRAGARAGDQVVVSGVIGDAAAALTLDGGGGETLRQRLHRPSARIDLGRALRSRARSAIDLSDGLLADLSRLLAEGQGAEIDLEHLPASDALVAAVADKALLWRLQTGGGSDYELLACLPPECDAAAIGRTAGVPLTRIGTVSDTGRIVCRHRGRAVADGLGRGWDHFGHD